LSLTGEDGKLTTSGESLKNLAKTPGSPKPGKQTVAGVDNLTHQTAGSALPWFQASSSLLKLENIFRTILGLPVKATITLGTQSLLVELAQTPSQWEKGLGGRDSLGSSGGMLFIFPYPHVPVFWMKDTRFPLDMIWIRDDIVVGIAADVPVAQTDKLPTYSPDVPINKVLEVPSGWSERNNLAVGDELIIAK